MALAKATLTIKQGADKSWLFSFTDSAGSAYDLTGLTITFAVKANVQDATELISETLSIVGDPTNGQARLTLASADTATLVGDYKWDIWFDDGAGVDVPACDIGTFTVLPRIVNP